MSESKNLLSQRLREIHRRCYQAGERHSLPDETSHFLQVDVIDDLEKAITQAEAQEAKAPISWRDIKVTKGQETHTLGTLIEPLEYERDTALASLKSQEAKAIGEQTPVVIKDSEVFTACETYADNYMIEGRITTSPKAMRKALENFLKYRK